MQIRISFLCFSRFGGNEGVVGTRPGSLPAGSTLPPRSIPSSYIFSPVYSLFSSQIYYIAQASFELTVILQPQPTKHWNHRHEAHLSIKLNPLASLNQAKRKGPLLPAHPGWASVLT